MADSLEAPVAKALPLEAVTRDLLRSARALECRRDAAETCVRFLVTTMDDLQLLPP